MIPRAIAFAGLAVACALAPAAAQPVPDSGRLDYVIERDGARIGTHSVTFGRDGGTLRVETRVEVVVRFAFITLYEYAKTSRETWRDGRMVAYEARTDDDGDIIEGRAELRPEGLVATGPKGRVVAPAGTMISSSWNVATIRQSALIDSEDATLHPITVTGGEAAIVTVAGRDVPARHSRIEGTLARELWYGDDGLLLRMRSVARDGSVIDTVPR